MIFIYKALTLFVLLGSGCDIFCAQAAPAINSVRIKKDSIVQHETAIIDRNKYNAIIIRTDNFVNSKFVIKGKNGKIVYAWNGDLGVGSFKFIDFNGDGYKDIILDFLVADSGEQDLLLYDPKSKKFVFAGNCSSAEKITNTKYHYSYQDCCMGREWSSELFYIDNSKIVNVGHIKYSDGYGLSFYKFVDKKKILIKRWFVRINGDTPVMTGKHIDFDLRSYWTKHWHTFIKLQ